MSMPTFDSISVDPEIMALQAEQKTTQAEAIKGGLSSTSATQDASKIKVNNMAELREKAPEVYESFMKSFAYQSQRWLQRANDRLIRRMKEARSNR